MRVLFIMFLFCVFCILSIVQGKLKFNENKEVVIVIIDQKYQELMDLSDKIWLFEEIVFQEIQFVKVLVDFVEVYGFIVKRGVVEIFIVFIVEFGFGFLVIGIFGEFDVFFGFFQ